MVLICYSILTSVVNVTYAEPKNKPLPRANKLFDLRLYSDKTTYRTTEKIRIWSFLRYIGPVESIRIWHGIPYISYTISDGKDFNIGTATLTILASTVLKKGVTYRFDYQKGGGYSADDPRADFWRKFYNQKDLFLPKGNYTVTVGCAFSLSKESNSSPGVVKELHITVN